MTIDYWKWPESKWVSSDIDYKKASVITVGIDVGSVSTQAVIMCDGELYAYSNIRSSSNDTGSARKAMDEALEGTRIKMEDIRYIVSTGYGRNNVPLANKAMTEIACHARGAKTTHGPTVKTVIDMGGQDCKVIQVDAQNNVINFLMNDRCASGTGLGMETFADLMAVPIQDLGKLSLDVDKDPEPVSNTCVIFANSEASGLLRLGVPKNKVLAAYCSGLANRVDTLATRVNLEKDLAITGGLAKNVGITNRLEKQIGFQALPAKADPQVAGAVGAAVFATEMATSGG